MGVTVFLVVSITETVPELVEFEFVTHTFDPSGDCIYIRRSPDIYSDYNTISCCVNYRNNDEIAIV